jgi:gliding motility-associated transport system ATP-binding protein
VIEISELYKYYGDLRAVGPLSATIEKGEIVGLRGLNGAGKTTTLRILACDLLPTSGSVRVGGIDVVERPDEVRAKIGYLPETPPLYGDMTVREYLRFVARLRGVSSADVDKRIDDALELTEVVREGDQLIATLSHGYRQRVGIAQAIVHQPELVVLDEPISGLDPVQIVEMRELVRSLGGDHTVLVSSHILQEISQTCDRILVIRDGEIVASGTETELGAKVLRGMQIDVSVRLDGSNESRVREVLGKVGGVSDVERIDPSESGERVTTFRLRADGDARAEVSRALVSAGVDLIELTRGERELERVFSELARTDESLPEKRARKKKALRRAEPKREAEVAAAGPKEGT